ncbi:MAG: histidine kinase [Acidipropionibacterium sp.]|nr:histidine kinase [Acidipropionibacterium sp.]
MSIRGIHDWFGSHPMVWDTILALLLTPMALAGTMASHTSWQRALWGLLYVVPLVWRRTRPDIAAAGVAAACLIQLGVGGGSVAGNLCVPIVVYAAIAYGSARRARWWMWGALAGSLVAGWRWTIGSDYFLSPTRGELVMNAAAITISCAVTVLMAWYAGRFARERRMNVEQLRQRAADLERERDQRVRLATQEERTRIAREMHDIVAHSLSVIVVQADGGAYLAHHEDAGAPQARLEASGKALDTIAETARQALTETRRLVGVLRDDSGRPADLAPSQGLADLARAHRGDPPGAAGGPRGLRGSRLATRLFPTAPTWPATGWSRSRSPTFSSTPGPAPPPGSASVICRTGWRSWSPTTVSAPRAPPTTAPGTVWSGCASGSPPGVARWRPDNGWTAASRCTPSSRWCHEQSP